MAIISTKVISGGTANAVILDPRQAFIYPFDIGEWNKIRVGMAISFTGVSSDNQNMDSFGTPSVSVSSARDRIYYGIKPHSQNFPQENNEPFIGFRSHGNSSYITFPPNFLDHRNEHGEKGYIGVHYPNGGVEGKLYDPLANEAYGVVTPTGLADDTIAHCGIITLYLEVLNKGMANQKMIVRHARQGGTDLSLGSMKNSMMSGALVNQGTFEYNNSGAPYVLPNSFFIYSPFFGFRLKIFSVAVIKEG